ncbi:MAG: hypothetical protein IPG10_06690 [Flavobacteriales bacterium]|nr:hypothetical protein [Flavobacteriales bacterium]
MTLLGCGLSGPVVFDVAPGSGPYVDRLILPQILGASSVNTITFNGNGESLEHSPALREIGRRSCSMEPTS